MKTIAITGIALLVGLGGFLSNGNIDIGIDTNLLNNTQKNNIQMMIENNSLVKEIPLPSEKCRLILEKALAEEELDIEERLRLMLLLEYYPNEAAQKRLTEFYKLNEYDHLKDYQFDFIHEVLMYDNKELEVVGFAITFNVGNPNKQLTHEELLKSMNEFEYSNDADMNQIGAVIEFNTEEYKIFPNEKTKRLDPENLKNVINVIQLIILYSNSLNGGGEMKMRELDKVVNEYALNLVILLFDPEYIDITSMALNNELKHIGESVTKIVNGIPFNPEVELLKPMIAQEIGNEILESIVLAKLKNSIYGGIYEAHQKIVDDIENLETIKGRTQEAMNQSQCVEFVLALDQVPSDITIESVAREIKMSDYRLNSMLVLNSELIQIFEGKNVFKGNVIRKDESDYMIAFQIEGPDINEGNKDKLTKVAEQIIASVCRKSLFDQFLPAIIDPNSIIIPVRYYNEE